MAIGSLVIHNVDLGRRDGFLTLEEALGSFIAPSHSQGKVSLCAERVVQCLWLGMQ